MMIRSKSTPEIERHIDYYMAMIERHGIRPVLRLLISMLDEMRNKSGYHYYGKQRFEEISEVKDWVDTTESKSQEEDGLA